MGYAHLHINSLVNLLPPPSKLSTWCYLHTTTLEEWVSCLFCRDSSLGVVTPLCLGLSTGFGWPPFVSFPSLGDFEDSAFLGLEFHSKMKFTGYKYYHLFLVTAHWGKALGSLKTNGDISCIFVLGTDIDDTQHGWIWRKRHQFNIFSLAKVDQPATKSPNYNIVIQPRFSFGL